MTDDNNTDFRQREAATTGGKTTIPVVEEKLVVTSREVTTGVIDVVKKVHTETVDVPLQTIHTHYREQRIPANRVVEIMPQTRYEGDNIIIPVVREEHVVVKRLILVEEIHLIKETETDERTETVELRSETATVNRHDPNQEFNATPPIAR